MLMAEGRTKHVVSNELFFYFRWPGAHAGAVKSIYPETSCVRYTLDDK